MIDGQEADNRVGDLAGRNAEAAGIFTLPVFGASVQLIVSHRGLAAEQELIEFLGLARLMQLYDGAEPGFSEAVEIARILRVPVSTFTIIDPGSLTELDQAYAELLYAAAPLSREQRTALANHITALADDLLDGGCAEPADSPKGRLLETKWRSCP